MAARATQEIIATVICAVSFALQQPLMDYARCLSKGLTLPALDALVAELSASP